METVRIPSGKMVIFGSPEQPLDPSLTAEIEKLLASIEGVNEAYLTEIFIMGEMNDSRQVLVTVIQNEDLLFDAIQSIKKEVGALIPNGLKLDLLPLFPDAQLLPEVRETETALSLKRNTKGWWKIW